MRLSFQSFYKNNVEAIDTKWLRFTSIQFNWILTQLKEKYKPTDSFSVIDLGCGTGRLLSLIHELSKCNLTWC
jgi:2-polyprenyl-3-methyl-5-hydroxy-6-metoxy-1,4-benzoquinol methylase